MYLAKRQQVLYKNQFFFPGMLFLITAMLIILLVSSNCSAAQLTVIKGGNGAGSVTSTPAGIDCGATCSHTFLDTDSVVLDATADGSSLFMDWDGCDQVTGSQCTVNMATAHTVTALFDAITTADYYVASTGDDSNSGLGWSRPFQTISKALSVGQNGEEIWVKAGTYVPPVVSESLQSSYFTISNKVNLYGGFVGNETDRNSRDPQNNQTTIDARSSGYFGQGFHVDTQYDPGPGRARIDGFVIRGGWALSSQYPFDTGGGIIVYSGAPLIANCEIKLNYAVSGGGIGAGYGTTIVNCKIHHNNAQNYGGGIQGNSGVQVINSAVYGNYSTYNGGGIAFWDGGTIDSSTVTGNWIASGDPSVAAGVVGYSSGTTTITNSIIWGNRQDQNPSEISFNSSSGANGTVSYSNVRGGYTGTGNIDFDPLFPDSANGDLRVQSIVPSINGGNDAAVPLDIADLDGDGDTGEQLPFDLPGNSRIEATVDMGAYEYIPGFHIEHTLSVIVDPTQSAMISGAGGVCDSSCTTNYFEGYQLTATAVPQNSNRFAYWEGCDSSNWDQCTVTMDSGKTITAHMVNETVDADGDTMEDWWEWYHFGSLNRTGNGDNDNDGLIDKDEFTQGTDPNSDDSDDDGMPDGWEVTYTLDPLADDADLDADSDGLTNLDEYQLGTNPQSGDTDGDSMPDEWEVSVGLNPTGDDAAADNDGDGVSNYQEYLDNTDPTFNYDLTYTSGPNGSINGDLSQTINEGQNGTSVEAVPASNYHFVNWSDGSTDYSRTDTNVTAHISVTANFAIDTFTLTYTPDANGSISGDGSQTADYGTDGTAVTAVPVTNYYFVEWSDGSTDNPRTDTNVTEDITVTATFSNLYTLTYNPGSHGSISGDTLQEVAYGSDGTAVTAVPDAGYQFVIWSDGETNATRTDTNVTADITVTASWSSDSQMACVVEAAAGENYNLVVKSDGTLWAWGANSYGQLGDGTNTEKTSPIQIGSDTDWKRVTAYTNHSLAIKTDGTLWTWGQGLSSSSNQPVRVGVDTNWQTVSVGEYHTVALKTDGTLWTWGSNWYGELGDGSTDNNTVPTQVGTDIDWHSVAAANGHNLALKTDGSLWAWGQNGNGQLGDGTTVNKLTPTLIDDSAVWSKIAAGYGKSLVIKSDGTLWGSGTGYPGAILVQIGSNTEWQHVYTGHNGFNLAIKVDNSLWAWGSNFWGQLGDGSKSTRSMPVQVGSDNDWRMAATGSEHSIGVKSDGALWVWGSNMNGALGSGIAANHNTPTLISAGWTAVGTGRDRSGAMKNDGTLWGWGGDGGQYPVQKSTDTDWQNISVGDSHSVAIKTDGTLWAWGSENLGNGVWPNITSSSVPIQIGTDNTWEKISVGGRHTLALKTNGTLWAWGYNYYGQAGGTSNSTISVPTQIGSDTDWEMVAAGYSHSLALKSGKTLYGWGLNLKGQLGDGTTGTSFRPTPTHIETDTDWVHISGGMNHSVAIKNNGTLWAWGYNYYGQLGSGSTADTVSPIQIGTATNWQKSGAGWYHTAALKTDGTLWTWGRNANGALADGTFNNRSTPAQIGGDTDWITLSCGEGFVLALKADNSLWAWGSNEYGQLGDETSWSTTPLQRMEGRTYVVTSSTVGNGSITPSIPQTVGCGSTIEFLLSADPHHHPEMGSSTCPAGVLLDNGDGTFNYTTGAIPSDCTVIAEFDPSSYTLTYSAAANGTLTGDSSQEVLYNGDGTTVTAVPAVGYHFVNWSDGVTTAERTDTNIDADLNVTANFAIDVFALNYSAGANGTLTGNVAQSVNYGADGTLVTAVADGGSHFVSWSDGLTTAARTDLNVTANISVTAAFEINTPHTLTYSAGSNGSISGAASQSVAYGADGTSVTAVPDSGYHFVVWSDGLTSASRAESNVTEHFAATADFAINAALILSYSAGSNGGIAGDTSQTVPYGADGTTVTAVPTTGYHFVSWSDGGLTAVRTDSAVAVNIAVSAAFSINSYNLDYAAGTNGTVSGDTSQTVFHGGDATAVTAKGDTGYHFVSWSDGNASAVRTDTNVSDNVSVTATFAADTSHNLTYAAGANGSLTGILEQTVNYGADGSTVTAVAVEGYHFVEWSDGVTDPARTDVNVTTDISVIADFAVDEPVVASVVMAGSDYNLVLNSDSTLWAWGHNNNGQLGDGTNVDKNEAVQVGIAGDWQTVSAGKGHVLAIKNNGSLWAWGYGNSGQLGTGNHLSQNSPFHIGLATDWQIVAAGGTTSSGGFSIAIKTDGSMWAWGRNYFGQLGDGTNIDRFEIVQVGSATDWQSVAAGDNHVLAVKTDGSLWTWGNNSYGQLGNGTTNAENEPVRIGTATDWQTVDGDYYFSLAIKTNGSLWGWGYNYNYQLGDGTQTQRLEPGLIGTATNWQSLATHSNHVLAVRTDGSLWAWGTNYSGVFGDGTKDSATEPLQIGASTDWQSIATGDSQSLGVGVGGSLWTWGKNDYGLLGNGTTADKVEPIQIGSGTVWQAVAAGGNVNTFGLQSNGNLWGWGSGKLGDGTSNGSSLPVLITAITDVASVEASGYQTFALKSDGSLWAWGTNNYGAIGDGTTTDRLLPVSIKAGTVWQFVAAGNNYALGIETDGSLWAWGANWYGRLGDGTSTSRSSPVPIEAGTTWQFAACGNNHSLAIQTDGSLWAWGQNSYGQLGNNTTANESIPVRVGTDTDWQVVAAGGSHTLAIKADGSLWAWGYNSYGQLGNDSTSGSTVPIAIGSDTDWQSVSAGYYFSLGMKTDGSLWAWGDNSSGQLGIASTSSRSNVPVQIQLGTTWLSFGAGSNHGTAIRADNTLWTWGSNANGQLGDGTSGSLVPLLLTEGVVFVVTPSFTGSGVVDPANPQDVSLGNAAQFTFTPDPSNFVVNVDGSCSGGELTDNNDDSWQYTTGPVMSDCTVIANFADTANLTYTSGANGSITGNVSQTVAYGDDGTSVTAIPDTGYIFVNWSDGVTTAERTDTNAQSTVAVTANFSNTIPLEYASGINGNLLGEVSQLVDYNGTGTSVTAIADSGYRFVDWSDGVTTQVRTDTNVIASLSVTANFASDTLTLTYTAEANGTIVGDTPQSVAFGGDGTAVTAQAVTGYHFTTWDDGVTTAERTETAVNGDGSFTAKFAGYTYTLTSSVSGGHGTIDPLGEQVVSHGDTAQFTLVPDSGYNSGPITSDCGGSLFNNTFTTGVFTGDCTVQAAFTLYGDIDGDDTVDLKDIIIGLQVLTNVAGSGYRAAADINGDGRIGLEEVVHILKEISQ